MEERDIYVNSSAKTTASEIVRSSNGIMFHEYKEKLRTNNYFVFHAKYKNEYTIFFKVIDSEIGLGRNGIVVTLRIDDIPENGIVTVQAEWTPTSLKIIARTSYENAITREVQTPFCLPPNLFYKWVKQQRLVPQIDYDSIDDFRARVHEALHSFSEKLNESYNKEIFWDKIYEGNKRISISPKRETDIHPLVLGYISDIMFSAGIEVIPESTTGVGNMDFMLVAMIKNHGLERICVEFKNAHSRDLEHGHAQQLPQYMINKNAQYGIYCMLWYKCDRFNQPIKYEDPEGLIRHAYVNFEHTPIVDKYAIKDYVFDLTPNSSASKI